MKIFFIKELKGIGKAGETKEISDGYARNFIIPHGFGLEENEKNMQEIKKHLLKKENEEKKVEKATSDLFNKIDRKVIIVKQKSHDSGALYGAVTQHCIVDFLKKNGIVTSKSQIILPEESSIKRTGSYPIIVKLSNKLQPKFILKIVSEGK